MEKNKSAIVKGHSGGSEFFVFDVPKEKLKLTAVEQKILDARVSNNALIQFATEELQDRFSKLLPKISAITGMPLPKNDHEGAIIKTEIITFLLEFGYKLLNEDEFLLAFRLNARGDIRFSDGTMMERIDPLGDTLNVHYCAKILSNYMILRNTFDSKLKNAMAGY